MKRSLISNPRLKAPTRVGQKKKKSCANTFQVSACTNPVSLAYFTLACPNRLCFRRVEGVHRRVSVSKFGCSPTSTENENGRGRHLTTNELRIKSAQAHHTTREVLSIMSWLIKKYFLAPKKAMRCCDICCHFSSSWHSSLAFLTLLVLARLHHPYAQLWLQKR